MKIILCALATMIVVASFAHAQKSDPPKEPSVPRSLSIATGEFWYRWESGKAEPNGFVRLAIEQTKSGGFSADWELRMNYQGSSYEEKRAMEVDASRMLVAANYFRGDELACEAKREGKKLVGRVKRGGEYVPLEREVKDDAATGLVFMFAATMPLEVKSTLAFHEYNEQAAFSGPDKITLTCMCEENLKIIDPPVKNAEGKEERPTRTIKVWRFDIKHGERPAISTWFDEKRRLIKAQWGADTFQVLSETPTRDLFKRIPPALEVVETAKTTLRLTGEFPDQTPQQLFDWFTKPDLLKKWWPQEADVELKVGGKYVLSWPQTPEKWVLHGVVKEVEAGKKFAFSWRWDGDPKDKADLLVTLTFDKLEKGCKLTIDHGTFGLDDVGQTEREGIQDGWKFFINKLRLQLAQ